MDTLPLTALWFLVFAVASSSSYSSYSSRSDNLANATCRNNNDCSDSRSPTYLKCISHKCVCEEHTAYDEAKQMCRVKRVSQCIIQQHDRHLVQPCVRNAYCAYPLDIGGKELRNAAHGTCQCFYPKSQQQDGTCSSANSVGSTSVFTNLVSISLLMFVGHWCLR